MSETRGRTHLAPGRPTDVMARRWVHVGADALDRGRGGVDVSCGHWPSRGGDRVFVCVHGLGGSAVNWMLLAPLLAEHGEVWAPDLAGFGLTAPTGRGAGIADNVDLLEGFVRTVSPERPVVLVGNSMGGLVSLMVAGGTGDPPAGLVLVSPASPRPVRAPLDRHVTTNFAMMAVPGLGERWMDRRRRRLTPAEQVRDTMRLCVVDPSRLDPAVVAAHEDMVVRRRHLPYVSTAFLQAARSLLLLVGPRAPALWRAIDAVDVPVLLLHGERDRLVAAAGIALLTERRPDWDLRTYAGLGHIPMLEDPRWVAADVTGWLAGGALDGLPGGP